MRARKEQCINLFHVVYLLISGISFISDIHENVTVLLSKETQLENRLPHSRY